MKPLRRICVMSDLFQETSPGQQLLDRFLIGYPRDGRFHRLPDCQVVACPLGASDDSTASLRKRTEDFGLEIHGIPSRAIQGADGVVIITEPTGADPHEPWIQTCLDHAEPEAAMFIYGLPALSRQTSQRFFDLALARKILLCAGTWLPLAWHLPEVNIPAQAVMREALIVVQGEPWQAELHGLEGLLPMLAKRNGGESGVRRLRSWNDEEVWAAARDGYWSWPLLASALSRSHSPQGDPVRDGRTQDLAGLRLVRGLAKQPRGWTIEHRDGLRTTILVLDGVVDDYNFAIKLSDGSVHSAQIYRPPNPAGEAYSLLAATLENFFRTGQEPWSADRSLLEASVLEAMREEAPENRSWITL